MKILLDTHVLLLLLEDNPRLTSRARQLIDDKENELCFSSISIAEIAIKHRKNPQLMPPSPDEVKGFPANVVGVETVENKDPAVKAGKTAAGGSFLPF